jgi:hypothetical protein
MASDGAKEQVTKDDQIGCMGGLIVLLQEPAFILIA